MIHSSSRPGHVNSSARRSITLFASTGAFGSTAGRGHSDREPHTHRDDRQDPPDLHPPDVYPLWNPKHRHGWSLSRRYHAPQMAAPQPHRTGPTSAYPEAVDRLIDRLASLPGIGRRSAERLAFFILKGKEADALELARAIADVKKTVRHCSVCSNLTHDDPCPICCDARRDRHTVLLVEQPKDLIALEQTGMYRGLYHVLLGRLSPLDGITPADLTTDRLLERLDKPEDNPGAEKVTELILGLNPTLEGDGTGLFIAEEAAKRGVNVTRLARGLPTGSQLEYANKAVLADAIQGRQRM